MTTTLTKDAMKAWIERASYEELLTKWRFEPVGSVWFSDEEISAYYEKHMKERKAALGDGMAASISKVVGWGRI